MRFQGLINFKNFAGFAKIKHLYKVIKYNKV